MGLLLDLSPDGEMNDEENDEELEAELLKLMGGGGGGGGLAQGRKGEGKSEQIISFHHLNRVVINHKYKFECHMFQQCC